MTEETRLLPVCKIPVCDRTDLVGDRYCSGHYQRIIKGITGDALNSPIRKRRTKAEMEADKVSKSVYVRQEAKKKVVFQGELMKPLPDQEVAIEKLRKINFRLCGDSMGVGKTVTGIGLDFAMREDNPELVDAPTLIVSEKIGLDVWDWHLRAMGVPDEQIFVINPADRGDFEEALTDLQRFQAGKLRHHPRYRYYVMHWDVLKSVPQINAKTRGNSGKPLITWGHVIADEVHLAKNRKAIRTIELKRIEAKYKTGLSGTPADDKPWDIWSILHWLYPWKYRSYWRFYEEHVQWINANQVKDYEKHIKKGGTYEEFKAQNTSGNGYRVAVGVKNIPELHRQMRPFYIRRTLLEVAPDMPEKTHVNPPIVVPMGRQQRREYEQMRDKAIALIGASQNGDGGFQLLAPAIIAVLTRLQQMALATLTPEWEISDDEFVGDEDEMDWDMPKIVLSKPSPKLDAVMNLITTHEEEPFVIFTQFRGMADLVEEECQRLKIPVVKIHGGIVDKNVRTRLVQEFQDGKARVFVGTIAAAGKTITLTRANHVIFTDLSWNPSKNAQAEDRLWRRTQRNAVRVYRIESEDSIDQIRFERISRKAEMISALLNPKKEAA